MVHQIANIPITSYQIEILTVFRGNGFAQLRLC